MKVKRVLEVKGKEILGIPVTLTIDSMDYFIRHVFHKKLSFPELHKVALDFLIPVFGQYLRMARGVSQNVKGVEVDFTGDGGLLHSMKSWFRKICSWLYQVKET